MNKVSFYGIAVDTVINWVIVISYLFFFIAANKTRVQSMCTESGIWQPVQFNCIFDPLAISLEEGGLLEGNTGSILLNFTMYM